MIRGHILNLCGSASLTIVEAMEKIDANAKGILFITSEDEKLIGAVTDGDIRRWLIKTANLKAKVGELMNRNPMFLYVADKAKALNFMGKMKIHAGPIIDD